MSRAKRSISIIIQAFDSPEVGARMIHAEKDSEAYCPQCRKKLVAYSQYGYYYFRHYVDTDCDYNELTIPMRLKLKNVLG